MGWQQPPAARAAELPPQRRAAPSHLPPAKAHDSKALFPACLCRQTHDCPKPRQQRHGEQSAMAWCKTSTNQCQLPLTHALLSAQPLNHTVFSLAVRQPTANLLVSPSKGERERRKLVENKIILNSLEKAACYEATEAMRGCVGR